MQLVRLPGLTVFGPGPLARRAGFEPLARESNRALPGPPATLWVWPGLQAGFGDGRPVPHKLSNGSRFEWQRSLAFEPPHVKISGQSAVKISGQSAEIIAVHQIVPKQCAK
jgi:hypothetical protein